MIAFIEYFHCRVIIFINYNHSFYLIRLNNKILFSSLIRGMSLDSFDRNRLKLYKI